MSKKKPFTVDDAYALETPADSTQLYGVWAETYDEDFVAASGYVVYRRVVEQLLKHRNAINGPVLDIGCGTGIVGVGLHAGGLKLIDGIDISPEMLEVSRKKRAADGDLVYRNLIAADLTAKVDLADDQYAALISAGTFTHGHLGSQSLDEMWRVAAPGAWCAIGVRTTHFTAAKFDEKLAMDVADEVITEPDLVEAHMYRPSVGDAEHANDKAFIIVCQVL